VSDCEFSESIDRLRRLARLNVQDGWRYCLADLPVAEVFATSVQDTSVAELNAKGYITWPAGRQVLWLFQRLTVPNLLDGYPLQGLTMRLWLSWWAEDARVFVNGEQVLAGDLFDSSSRLLLASQARAGEEFAVALRLVSPGHDVGALVRSLLLYEASDPNCLDPGFVADELEVLQEWGLTNSQSPPTDIISSARQAVKGETIKYQINLIDWEALPNRQQFEASLSLVRQKILEVLQPQINADERGCAGDGSIAVYQCVSAVDCYKSYKIWLLGHAHLDLAWLWPVSETWEAAQRTFESVLGLQEGFPDLIFCHSTPALYAWVEENRPDLFAAIQARVAAGKWEVVGGMWVEPDLILVDGESIVRQVLYGQRYAREKFGQLMRVVWVPDSFGFCWQLPQILKQGGVEYFVTQKLRWNDTTRFPYGAFWWEAPDGSQIFSLMSALIGENIEPVKMAKYSCEWERQTGLKEALWLPGVGDHGGGPTRDMLEIAKRWEKSPFFPRLEFTTAVDYLRRAQASLSGGAPADGTPLPHPIAASGEGETGEKSGVIPVWRDELYLEFHRGCYTTHAEQKRWNRRCEGLLYRAELFASLATVSAGAPYPQADLEDAWKKVLFNQFHDILPGSSIPQVYADANQAWVEVERVGSQILQGALSAIAEQISLPAPPQPGAMPVIVFNPLNWKRSEVVAVSLPASPPFQGGVGGDQNWAVCDLQGDFLPSQLSDGATLLFLAADIPPVGYCVFWLIRTEAEDRDRRDACPTPDGGTPDAGAEKDWVLENEFLRVAVEGETGNLRSVFDKVNSREILEAGGNQLQAFADSGQYWDAWNIDPNYEQHRLPAAQLKSVEWVERGALRSRLRVVVQLGESVLRQDYILDVGLPVLKIATTADWKERHVLLKAAFPLNLEADCATYEMACGAIRRTTKPQTPSEKAKWEVPALRWADLSEDTNPNSGMSYGVSLLNDCKYGYDAKPNQLRLTLLRSPSWPDPEADLGYHEFTYAVYPHTGTWQSAGTVRRGYELNQPLLAMILPRVSRPKGAIELPAVGCLLDLSAENLILMAFKQSEDNPNRWVLRCYECHGEEALLRLESDLGLEIEQPVDLLEQPALAPQPDGQYLRIAPWKIASLAVAAGVE
jgi:alpha-mannosidase